MNPAIFFAVFAALALAPQIAPMAQPAKPAAGKDPVVAVVNGDKILLSDVMVMMEAMPEQFRQVPLAAVYNQILKQTVDRKLVSQAARSEGMRNDPTVKRRLAFIEESVLQEAYFTALLEAALTQKALRALYDRTIGKRPGEDKIHARHILVKTEAEARKVISEIRGGADFAAVAKKKSTAPTSSMGGDLGIFDRKEMVAEFSEVAFAMKPGEVTDRPVHTQFGWHVIKVEGRSRTKPPSFKESAEGLRNEVTGRIVDEALKNLRQKANIELIGSGAVPGTAPGTAPAIVPVRVPK